MFGLRVYGSGGRIKEFNPSEGPKRTQQLVFLVSVLQGFCYHEAVNCKS